jgi:hypothetical protein
VLTAAGGASSAQWIGAAVRRAAPATRAGLRMVNRASTPPATQSAPEMSDAVWNPAENTFACR